MQIRCSDIIDAIRADFGALWSCSMAGNTLEISTPYLLPNDDALTVYVTTRGDRIIVSDGGFVSEFLAENSSLAGDKLDACKDHFASRHEIKSHQNSSDGLIYYFKEANSLHLVSSLIFDVGNFVTALTNAAIPQAEMEELRDQKRFNGQADSYIKTLLPTIGVRKFRKKIGELPSVRFGAVVSSDSHLWLVSYVSGSTQSAFVHNISMAYMNFTLTRKNPICEASTLIALVNDTAEGYRPMKQGAHLDELHSVTGLEPIPWTQRSRLQNALSSFGPKLSRWNPNVPFGN